MANLLQERLNADSEEPPVKKPKKKPKKKAPKEKVEKPVKIKPKSKKELRIEKEKERQQEKTFDDQIEALTADDFIKEQKKIKRTKRNYYFVKIFMCFMCGYLLFLIYGVLVTNYDYDKDGNVAAQIMTKEEIEQQKEFSMLMGYYMDARSLYEKILILNYRFDQGVEDHLNLVPEYEKLLDDASRIIIQLNAVQPSKGYTQAYSLLLNWVNADLASYLQEISAAISQNSAEHMQNAINDKQRCYNDCYQLTANMISLGDNIKGVNTSELKEWSPEQYIKDECGEV